MNEYQEFWFFKLTCVSYLCMELSPLLVSALHAVKMNCLTGCCFVWLAAAEWLLWLLVAECHHVLCLTAGPWEPVGFLSEYSHLLMSLSRHVTHYCGQSSYSSYLIPVFQNGTEMMKSFRMCSHYVLFYLFFNFLQWSCQMQTLCRICEEMKG